jgi:hypothetical protein
VKTGPVGIYWGELVACPEGFSATKAIGWDPAVVTIVVTRDHAADWLLKQSPERFKDLEQRRGVEAPQIAAALTESVPRRLVALSALPYRADLVVRLLTPDGPATWGMRDLFLVEARVVDAQAKPDLIELVLSDVMRWWEHYGCVPAILDEVNILQGYASDGTPVYLPRSLKQDGSARRPWKLREVLQLLLEQLPGQPRILEFPEFLDGLAPPMRAFGAEPLQVLKKLAARATLAFAFAFDGTCGFWPRGIGLIGECENGIGARNGKEHNPERNYGCWQDQVPDADNKFSRRLPIDAPDEVLVVLPPPIWTVTVDYLEPVLPIEEIAADGGPPTHRAIEVKPDLLKTLTGVPTGGASGGPVVTSEGGTEDDLSAVVLLRGPLLSSEKWPASIDGVPDKVQDLIRERLWRWLRLPERYDHLGPLLDRAETDSAGKRWPIVVEAFGWRSFRGTIEKDKVPDLTPDETNEIEKQIHVLELDLARLRLRRRALEQVKAIDIVAAWDEIQRDIPAVRKLFDEWQREHGPSTFDPGEPSPGPFDFSPVASAYSHPRRNAADLTAASVQGAQPTALSPRTIGDLIDIGLSSQQLALVLQKLGRQAPRALAELLQVPNADLLDPALKDLAVVVEDEKRVVEERAELLKKVDPAKALEEELAREVEKLQTEIRATGGFASSTTSTRIQQLQDEIFAIRHGTKWRAKRTVEVTMHMNLGRRAVPFSIHPGRLIEISEPGGWLLDPTVSDAGDTLIMPLPSRITFGTYNLPRLGGPPDLPNGKVTDNVFIQSGVDVLTSEAELQAFAKDFGHYLPKDVSTGPIRLTFSAKDKTSGKAEVGPHPYRVTLDGPEWQTLYGLPKQGGDGVRGVNTLIIEKAAAIAADLMAGQVLAAGSFRVFGARYVVCNGQISAVRWASDKTGHVDTTVFCDAAQEPIPGLERPAEKVDAKPLKFGFELEDGEGGDSSIAPRVPLPLLIPDPRGRVEKPEKKP